MAEHVGKITTSTPVGLAEGLPNAGATSSSEPNTAIDWYLRLSALKLPRLHC